MNLASYGKIVNGWYLRCNNTHYIARSKSSLKRYASKHNITLYWRRDVNA